MDTVKFYTLGCKVNQYDTQSIRERFIQAGFKELEDGLPADIYVINTCTVTQGADSDSLNIIRRAKRENPKARIVVTGCLAKKDTELLSSLNMIDFVIGKEFFSQGITGFSGHTRAFLKIQDGCENFCSYCKVPLVRGRLKSKPLNEIVAEAAGLIKNGFKEIVLCGICLGAYGRDFKQNISLLQVIDALENLGGLLRLRLSSIELSDISDELIKKMRQSEKLCRHLHIPLQSGDDEILKKMNRNYSGSDYLNIILKIKKIIPKIAITTDVLVGFPGESEDNFQNTLNLIKQILPLKAHIFPFSSREGTAAAIKFGGQLNHKIIKERVGKLRNISQDCAFQYKKQFLDKNMDVLIEAPVKDNPDFWEGYTDNYIKVMVKSNVNLKNQLVSLRLKKVTYDNCLAEIT